MDRTKSRIALSLFAVITGIGLVWTSVGRSCDVFLANNIWNTPVDQLPLDANSRDYIDSIGSTSSLHPDFGSGTWPEGSDSPIGIPYVLVPGTQPKVPVKFTYKDESDPGPYPIPENPPIEGGPRSKGDRHILVIDTDNCRLYELFAAYPQAGGGWSAGSGAVFDLKSNALRPSGWTSADAAGLPIFAGLIRYEEVASGEIRHAIRFTAPETRKAFVWPARHYASSLTGEQYPPMGQRFRLKAGFNISSFSQKNQVILRALKRYGMILADNGSPWFLSGAPDSRWNNDDLHKLTRLVGSNFEAVDVSSLMIDPDSGAAGSGPTPSVTVQVRALKDTAYERGVQNGSVRFARVGDLNDPVTVYYTVDGTATNGTDYVRLPGSFTIPAGSRSKVLPIAPKRDRIQEGPETVIITISKNPLYKTGASASATVTIVDNE
jgi:hypothetical protein